MLKHSFVFLLLSALSAQAYRHAAPAAAVDAKPLSLWTDWLPGTECGPAMSRNESVQPDQPLAGSGAPTYGAHGTCEVASPVAQKSFWLENVPHQGISPFLVRGHGYKVFRSVKDYGAVGDGLHDDTPAINAAIRDGGRCSGGACGTGTTGQPALVYIPPGTYLLTGPLQLFVGTQVIGDAVAQPTLQAASSFSPSRGSIVAGFDPGAASIRNFFIGLRNVVINSAEVPPEASISLLNWAVSQATSLVNVSFVMPADSQHRGLIMDGGTGGGGSGTFMGDLSFEGGLIGIHLNSQQYAFRSMTFVNVATAIAVQHLFVGTFQQMHFRDCGVGVDVGGIDDTGSFALIDSTADSVGTVVSGTATMTLESIRVSDSGATWRVGNETRLSGSVEGKAYVVGSIYYGNRDRGNVSAGTYIPQAPRPSELTEGDGLYFTKPLPQYMEYSSAAFVSVKDHGAKGDGQTDDTAAINALLQANANCKITYFPHGVYLVTDTIYVPPGSRLVGEAWSVLSAAGSEFGDESDPRVMLQVGRPGDVGTAEMSDMLFTVADTLPGAIMVEVNMAGKEQGDVSFHNCHWRAGGAADSNTESQCQSADPCKAAFMMLHIAPSAAQCYIENAWLWSADSDLDGAYGQTIGTGRGLRAASTGALWLVGTASEHHVLYAYQFDNARNVFASMQQVEAPYYQPVPEAPSPWSPNASWNDPDFNNCNRDSTGPRCQMQWALRILGEQTENIKVYGTGSWTFFNNRSGECGATFCQENVVELVGLQQGTGVELYNVNTHGAKNLILLGPGNDLDYIAAEAVDVPGSWGAVIGVYLGYS